MLILCKTSQVRQGGYRWRIPLPWGWQIRWQRLGCYIVAGTIGQMKNGLLRYPERRGERPW